MWDRLLVDCNVATFEDRPGSRLGLIENGAIGISDGKIVRVGKRTELAGYRAKQVDALNGAWVTPGLIDCHTHLVFGGTRADEHAMRRAGATYEEIAKAGGGIASTVAKTAAASDDELIEQSRRRLHALMRGGCTTIEIKTGYGLDPDAEVQKALRLVFDTFERTGSAMETARFFLQHGLLFPRRLRIGPNKGDLLWAPPQQARILQVLHNPRYAGAFVYGRTRTRHMPDGSMKVIKMARADWQFVMPGMLGLMTLLLSFVESDAALSARAGWDRTEATVVRWPVLLMKIQLSLVYFYAAIAKLKQKMREQGMLDDKDGE